MSKKIAIIGAGGMAAYHIAGFRQAGAEVIAMADVNHAAAQATAAKQGIDQTFGDVAEMFAALPELDGVSVIVPNKFHAPLALQAMQAGKHVFCEKPPAMSAAEMAELKNTAESTGRTLMFNFNNRARPESYAMRGYLNDGSIGTINSCQAKWIRRAGIPGFGGWFTNKALAGGGPLIDLLHMIDLGMHFMGYPEPAHILARTFNDHIDNKAFKGPWGIPDNAKGVNDVEAAAHGFITFKTGQSLSFQVSWAEMNEREECSCIFQGSKAGGMIRYGIPKYRMPREKLNAEIQRIAGMGVDIKLGGNPEELARGDLTGTLDGLDILQPEGKRISQMADKFSLILAAQSLHRPAGP